ncbi:MAG: Eco57I restriction-modification methylase domain-containing protein [Anaerolineaceae bacterium]|nr:Eco57I restriction-modification methylase domain-containing protein [Anaerolineaceae bacterium]
MNELETKRHIEQTLARFSKGNLRENGIAFLNALGYRSGREVVLEPNTFDGLADIHAPIAQINREKALVADWVSVDILFQLTGDDIRELAQARFVFDGTTRVDNQIIESYLFITIKLKQAEYSRSKFADITREINKFFAMPVMVLFQHGSSLTLSLINRRLNKREENKDVLEKVTLIKGINHASPLRAHIEILFDLSLNQLQKDTRFHNFVDLHNAWQKALDTSELNKKFYREVANWYFWAVTNVTFPKDAGNNTEQRNAIGVIRLITRLIFVWFLREKGLIPDDLFSQRKLAEILNYKDNSGSTYYKAILQNLFFATLNQEMNSPGKRDRRDFRKDGQNYNITNLYRYKSYFKNPDQALDLFQTIPFLNGGLFECLDKTGKNDSEKVQRVDGFSDRSDNEIVIPDWLFFSPEKNIDLNEIYDTRNKQYKVRGLIDIFDSYKFTIEENTPIEEEIALDPELLGKVFENLLASFNPETGTTARKQTGSFYTPREIVDYMVDEALLAYFEGKLGESSENRDRLRDLLAYNATSRQFSKDEIYTLVRAIDSIKVIDPACGSGAFPMGMLHKLVFILQKLDPQNVLWREIQKERALQETSEAYTIGDTEERRTRLLEIEETFEKNLDNYGRKLFLIQNCIYGVDIQPIAVQISKLRFFISLVVDQRIDDKIANRNIRPLPNLETRFVAANTLISIERPQQTSILRNMELDQKEAELAKIRKKHFAARTPATKRKYREEDEKIRKDIGELLKKEHFLLETTEKLAKWNPYDQNTFADFFDPEWMFWLPEGFDVVIGNPPYMRVQMIQQTQPEFMPYYREHYKSAQGSFDLYALFIEKGYRLMKTDGQLAYIVPHKFFQAAFGEGLRKLLTNRKALRQIVRFGAEQVFEEATTYTCLLFLSARKNDQFDLIEVKSLERGEDVFQAVRRREEHPDYAHESLPEPEIIGSGHGENVDWDFSIGSSNLVLKRIKQHPKQLGDLIRKIFQGIATSADKIYVLEILSEKEDTYQCFSKQLGEEVEIEKGLVKPFLMGKDVHRYENVTAKNVVIFPYRILNGKAELMPQNFIREKFPLGWQYLERNENALAEREHGRMHGQQFYAYIYPKNLIEFEAVKIMTPDICNGPQMTIDLTGSLYHTTTIYSFIFKPGVVKNEKYLLGLMNSHLLWYFLAETGTVLRGGYLRFKTEYLKPFPIAESRPEQEQAVATFVDYVLFLKALPESSNREEEARRRLMTAYFEQLVNALIYEIYFPEEFLDAGKSISRLLTSDQVPPIEKFNGDKPTLLQQCFQRMYQQNHPVRQMTFFLDTIEAVRIIEERLRGNENHQN